MYKFLTLLAITALTTACATPEQQAQKTLNRYGPYCEKLGYQKNSDNWRDCIMKEQKRVTDIIFSKD